MRVTARQGDTLDAICQRYFGRTAGVTEQALALTSGLASLGPVLPLGTAINLPDAPAQVQRQQVQLWD
ncbi:tail protein X [Silvimonas sp.]|uniref:tail protein X n=1 Tax=Silvimonas sp. TaxID=2650811 RepID=UPI00284F6028|nr:tail protein X [Silvimonas sp.]MDR3429676.1 tail protein X [Silvimonas sp.]